MPFDFITCGVVLVLSAVVALISSELINCFYRLEPEVLSFPFALNERKKRRFMIIALGMSVYLWLIALISRSLAGFDALLFVTGRFCLAWWLLIIICTDFEQQVIFDRLLVPMSLLGIMFSLVGGAPLLTHILAALAGGAFFLFLAVISHGGIGGGDIKLMACLGLWCGKKLLPITVWGLILAGLAAILLLVLRQKKRREFFAYGPYFAFSALYIMASP